MAEPAPDHVRSVTTAEYERLTAAWLARAPGEPRPVPAGPAPPPAPVPVPWSVPPAPSPLANMEALNRIVEAFAPFRVQAAPAPHPAPPDPGPPPDLKVGDEVEARFGREWVRCVVAESYPVRYAEGPWGVWLRRKGRTRAGHLWPSVSRRVTEVRLVRKYDPQTANVFADFLEEQGFAEAADALRAAFPLAGGESPA